MVSPLIKCAQFVLNNKAKFAVRSKAVVLLFVVDSLFIVAPIVSLGLGWGGVCVMHLFCFAVFSVLSGFPIIFIGMRKLVSLL